MTLGRQLILSGLLVLLALFVGMIWFTINNTQTFLNHQLTSHAQDTATVLGLSLTNAMEENDTIIASRMVDSIWDRGYYQTIEVENLSGLPIVSKSMPVQVEGVPAWFISALKLHTEKEEALIQSGWKQAGRIYVESNPGYAYKQIWTVFTQSFIWFCIIAVIALGLGLFLLHLILKPLREVTKQAYAICNQEFLIQDRLPWTIDLKQVVLAMNNMSSRLKVIFEEQTKATEALREQAFQSPVAGIGNRRFFDMTFNHMLSEEKHMEGVLLLLELQGFKAFNDKHGYEKGDALIKATADTLQQASGQHEAAPVAHLGGANFALLLPSKDLEVAKKVATDILHEFGHFKEKDITDSLDVGHLGLCSFSAGDQATDVLAKADVALRSAQTQGPNQFSVHQDAKAVDTKGAREWGQLLDTVIASQAIELVFQPFKLFGLLKDDTYYEALMRIRDTQGNQLAAGQFMPMAERLGKILELDKLVIEKTIQLIRGGSDHIFSMNLSATSLDDESFRRFLLKQVKSLGKRSNQLIVELPEYGVLNRVTIVADVFRQLKSCGAQTAIDHYGQNFTSFGYLHSISLSFLKIDGSFVRNLAQSEENQFFIRSLIGIAHSLDVKVVAEAVETKEELQILQQLKVDGVQGYLIGKPGELD